MLIIPKRHMSIQSCIGVQWDLFLYKNSMLAVRLKIALEKVVPVKIILDKSPEPERFCCWGNTLWPARKNIRIHTRSNCRSPSLIPLPDSSHLKSRNYTPAKKVGRNWTHGKRSILIKVRSEVNFKDNMQRDALLQGIPLFGTLVE